MVTTRATRDASEARGDNWVAGSLGALTSPGPSRDVAHLVGPQG
jgi:hypothetical protein